jgi:hypothetical protein
VFPAQQIGQYETLHDELSINSTTLRTSVDTTITLIADDAGEWYEEQRRLAVIQLLQYNTGSATGWTTMRVFSSYRILVYLWLAPECNVLDTNIDPIGMARHVVECYGIAPH